MLLAPALEDGFDLPQRLLAFARGTRSCAAISPGPVPRMHTHLVSAELDPASRFAKSSLRGAPGSWVSAGNELPALGRSRVTLGRIAKKAVVRRRRATFAATRARTSLMMIFTRSNRTVSTIGL